MLASSCCEFCHFKDSKKINFGDNSVLSKWYMWSYHRGTQGKKYKEVPSSEIGERGQQLIETFKPVQGKHFASEIKNIV